MGSLRMRSMSGKAKVLIAGTVLAGGLAGFVAMPAAQAVTTATTKLDAEFWCDSTCNVPPVGQVARGAVGSDHGTEGDPRHFKIDSGIRTVDIRCKWSYSKQSGRQYRVSVQDTGWSGAFWVYAGFIADDGKIDTSTIRDCSGGTSPPY